ncbi:HD domain-containing protein [Oscillospiraceae bacterium MB08-C2-2]|nr:HD domain-containing protein [Oscillospiraceae bacterium MB08-C2-2]
MNDEKRTITYTEIRANEEIRAYIKRADETLLAMGFTEHYFGHVEKCAKIAGNLLVQLGYDKRTSELARIAAYMHDIGNVVNRSSHAQSGAIMAFEILTRLGMEAGEIASIVTAIGNHDEGTGFPVNAIAAALILADKSDVRRTRVRNRDRSNYDIHDRVNYAVEQSSLNLDAKAKTVTLELTIDTTISAVMDYFEIFMDRMLLCRKAAEALALKFQLHINGISIL